MSVTNLFSSHILLSNVIYVSPILDKFGEFHNLKIVIYTYEVILILKTY